MTALQVLPAEEPGSRPARIDRHHVRSYVLGPEPRAKDLRTAVETADVEAVLDGDLDTFLAEAIRHGLDKPVLPGADPCPSNSGDTR